MISTDTTLSKRIIEKFDQGHITLLEIGLTNDRVAMTSTPDLAVGTVLNAVVSPYKKGEIDGSLIRADDIQVYADAEKAIDKGNHIRIGSDRFRIVHVREYNPAGTVLGYVLQCRK